MKNSGFLLAVIAMGAEPSLAAPRGHLAYLQNGYAVVGNAATGRSTRLPRSKGARALSISPRGTAVYFVAPPGSETDGPIPQDGFLSQTPYKTARKLPPGLQKETFGQLKWSASGKTLWLRGFEISGVFTPAMGNFKKLGDWPESASRDGKVVAFQTGDEIRVREASSGRERIIFSIKKPLPLFAALKSGKNQKKLRDLVDMIAEPLDGGLNNWAISSPALSPGGSRLYFASNAGTGQGAAGNSSWALFAFDLKTGKLAVLSKVGAQFGRMPDVFEVSPDGKRLLAIVSVHSSAVENPSYALVVDLLTQNSREILGTLQPKNADSNLVWGACWSPDSRYVAISAYFYDTAVALKQIDNWNGPKDTQWTLYIQDAATGKTARRIAGARGPSWGN